MHRQQLRKGEDESLGSLESETQATKLASRSPKHNNNTSSLDIGTKNKAAYGILIDTGAAISLAPTKAPSNLGQSPAKLKKLLGEERLNLLDKNLA